MPQRPAARPKAARPARRCRPPGQHCTPEEQRLGGNPLMAICLAWRGAGRPFLALLVLLLGFPVGRGSQGNYGTRPCQAIGITSPDRGRSCCRTCTSSGIIMPGKTPTTLDERRGIVRPGRKAGGSANRHFLGANGVVTIHGALPRIATGFEQGTGGPQNVFTKGLPSVSSRFISKFILRW